MQLVREGGEQKITEKTMKIIMEKPFVVEMMKNELKSTSVTLTVKR